MPAFSTPTKTWVCEGIVWVGPGSVDPAVVAVGSAEVVTSMVCSGVGTGVEGCLGAGLVQPAARSRRKRTSSAQISALLFMKDGILQEYKRILVRHIPGVVDDNTIRACIKNSDTRTSQLWCLP